LGGALRRLVPVALALALPALGASTDPNAALASALEAGSKSMVGQSFDACAEGLLPMLAATAQNPGTVDFAQVEEAQLLLAVCQYRAHHLPAAGQSLLELFRLFPDAAAKAPRYPPPFQRAMAVARVKADELPKGAVTAVGVAGMVLFVDGHERGPLPWAGTLPVGRHFFAAGPKAPARPVDIPSEGTTVRLDGWDEANPALHPGAPAVAQAASSSGGGLPWWAYVLGGAVLVGAGVGTYAVVSSHGGGGTVSATW
jgi:hypothetical protein